MSSVSRRPFEVSTPSAFTPGDSTTDCVATTKPEKIALAGIATGQLPAPATGNHATAVSGAACRLHPAVPANGSGTPLVSSVVLNTVAPSVAGNGQFVVSRLITVPSRGRS